MEWSVEADWLFETVEEKPRVERAEWLTVERAAYIAVGLLAAAVRFVGLGLRPLNSAEAEQALAAFRFLNGDLATAPAGTLPALFTANVVGFTVAGAGDAVARWLPARAGLVLALLPYALRHRLGRGGALVASLLLALSPTALFSSRTAGGATLVAACTLALVIGLLNYSDTRRPGWLYLAAAALGLGLAAGPGIYSALLILALYGLLLFLARGRGQVGGDWASLKSAYEAAREHQAFQDDQGGGAFPLLALAGAVAAALFALVVTTFALHPAGIGHAADLVGTWIQDLLPRAGRQPALYPLLLLLRYELLLLFLATVETVRWARARGGLPWVGDLLVSHTRLLIFWAAAALLLSVIGTRDPGSLLLSVVPLALLAGMAVQHVAEAVGRRLYWSDVLLAAAIALGIAVFVYLQLAAYSKASTTLTTSVAGVTLYAATTHLLLGLVALLLLVALAAFAWLWRGPALAAAAGWLALLVVLALFGLKGMWAANLAHAADPRELMILHTTDPEVRLMVNDLQAASLDLAGDRHTLPVTVDPDLGPVVDWYLRHFRAVQEAGEPASPAVRTAAITLAGEGPPGETFRGQSYVLDTHWLPWGLWGQHLVRWLLFTDDSLPVVDREVVLWVER